MYQVNQRPQMMCTMQYVDCSMYGGYDPKDPCNHTCRSDRPVRPMIVPQEMALEQLRSEYRPMEPMMCTMQYVSCPGGYDPSDPCRHTCLKPENTIMADLQNLKVYEGSVFDMGTVYNGDQGVMALGNTGKHQVNFDKIESGEGSTIVFMF